MSYFIIPYVFSYARSTTCLFLCLIIRPNELGPTLKFGRLHFPCQDAALQKSDTEQDGLTT